MKVVWKKLNNDRPNLSTAAAGVFRRAENSKQVRSSNDDIIYVYSVQRVGTVPQWLHFLKLVGRVTAAVRGERTDQTGHVGVMESSTTDTSVPGPTF